MGWKETIEKLEKELEKIEEKEKKISENKKEVRAKLAAARKGQEAEKNQKIASLIEGQLGDLSDEKLDMLKLILEDNASVFQNGMKETGSDPQWKGGDGET